MKLVFFAPLFFGVTVASTAAFSTSLLPEATLPSSLILQIEEVATVAPASGFNNYASPVAISGDLYVVDQNGRILRQNGNDFVEEIGAGSTIPIGVTLAAREGVMNIAGRDDSAFVTLRSTTLPDGFTAAPLPDDPFYPGGEFELVYRYDRAADGSLSNPVLLTAFESTTRLHTGGGMLVLPDGRVALARGDELQFNLDGLSAPQDNVSTVSRILLIDPDTGATEVAAQGVRNVQRLTYADAAETQIAFADIGAQTAEEINVISTADLGDTSTIENFGWGRNADGNAREGTFYIDDGALSGTEPAVAIAVAPEGEAGFIQPYAQFGRDGVDGFFAVTGPLASDVSFSNIEFLFGDLVNGQLFATTGDLTGVLADVFRVGLQDTNGDPLSLLDLSPTVRVDPRFFNFADGSAGVFLESSGKIFRLTEIDTAVVPLPAGGILLASGIVLLGRRARRKM